MQHYQSTLKWCIKIKLHQKLRVILSLIRNIRHGQFNFHLNLHKKLKNHNKNRSTQRKIIKKWSNLCKIRLKAAILISKQLIFIKKNTTKRTWTSYSTSKLFFFDRLLFFIKTSWRIAFSGNWNNSPNGTVISASRNIMMDIIHLQLK